MTMMRKNWTKTKFAGVSLVCGVFAFGLSAHAQISSAANMQIMQNGQNAKDQKSGSGSSDKTFVKKALQGGMAEIQASKLALDKSTNPDVKKFAQQMVDDHTKLGEDMKPVAAQVGVGVPDEPAKKDKAMIAKLQALSGADFDKAYVRYMLKDHEMDAAAFKTEASSGLLVPVKDAAAKGDPVIESHLQMIQGIAKTMNVTD